MYHGLKLMTFDLLRPPMLNEVKYCFLIKQISAKMCISSRLNKTYMEELIIFLAHHVK